MNLICMGFDGDYQTEGRDFPTVKSAWERSEDMGSRWYFYPFHFVTSDSGKTIKDAPELLSWAIGRRVESVQKLFACVAKTPEALNADADRFAYLLLENCSKRKNSRSDCCDVELLTDEQTGEPHCPKCGLIYAEEKRIEHT